MLASSPKSKARRPFPLSTPYDVNYVDWRIPTIAQQFAQPRSIRPTPSPNYNVKRACQPCDRRVHGGPQAIQRSYVVERDESGLVEYRLKNYRDSPRIGPCALCDPDTWAFFGSQYDPYLTLLYAEHDGCIPSSVVTRCPKFIIPWRYKNERTGQITWKIFHLTETIIVNASKDIRLKNVKASCCCA